MSRRPKDQRRLTTIYFHSQGRVDEYTVNEKGRLANPIASGSRRPPTPMRLAPIAPQPTTPTLQSESEIKTIAVFDIEELEPMPIDFRAWDPWNDFDFALSPSPESTGCYAGKQQFLLD
jgi:hypothetical protein